MEKGSGEAAINSAAPVHCQDSGEPIRLHQQEQRHHSQALQGQASWYGPGLYGNKTTSGEILKKGTMTAAHSSLPMGTKVKVTRLDNNKSVTVVINDRKPFKQGTVIDLAHGSATALDVDDDGKTAVEIEVLD